MSLFKNRPDGIETIFVATTPIFMGSHVTEANASPLSPHSWFCREGGRVGREPRGHPRDIHSFEQFRDFWSWKDP